MIVWLDTETVPVLAVVYPAFAPVVDGALQPAGTSIVTEPFESPPAAAVYVNAIVFPPEPFAYLGVQATRWSLAQADRRSGRRNLWLRALDAAGMGYDS